MAKGSEQPCLLLLLEIVEEGVVADTDAAEEKSPAFPAKSALVLCCFGGCFFAGSVISHEEKADEILLGVTASSTHIITNNSIEDPSVMDSINE